MSKIKLHISRQMILRIILLAVMDMISILVVTVFAIYVRYDFSFKDLPEHFLKSTIWFIPINLVVTMISFVAWNLYTSVWRYASATELIKIVAAVTTATIGQVICKFIFKLPIPRSYPLIYLVALLAITSAIRFSYRALRILRAKRRVRESGKEPTRCMVIGAGSAGNEIIKEISTTQYLTMKVCCIVDDGPGCWGKKLRGVPIVGGRDVIVQAAAEYNIAEIIIAIPSAKPAEIKEIVNICKETGCKMRILPGMYQLINGEVDIDVSKLRDVQIEDLLGREPVSTNLDEIMGYVSGRVIMVTGGGGSIGSELCRQIAGHNPKQLIIVDIYENNAYDIEQELKRKYPELNLVVLIASVRNTLRMDKIFEEYRPEIVYHAAAHKHVPLMEESPNEAIKNNVLGTLKVVKAADKWKVKKFVLISTDKAVNPTNVMGATKRICEMIVQTYNERSETEFVAVRFGNVLGSNGSVIPLFKKQIEDGGPVTVTHPDIIRYFMTIPEAVALVLQAGAYAKGGEIFVLDMGEPVKILDLAENLIKLSGLRVGDDIEIVFTGLRPGEKLYEEMLMDEEGLTETRNKRIHIGHPINFDEKTFMSQIEDLKTFVEGEPDIEEVKKKIAEIVPTYKAAEDDRKAK